MTMAKSSIQQLEKPVREELDRLIRDGYTLDSIIAKLRELGDEDTSRSAVGRYAKKARDNMRRYEDAQQVAGVWIKRLEDDPKGDVGKLVAEMLKTVSFVTIDHMLESVDDVDKDGKTKPPATPQEIMYLAKAIKELEQSGAINFKKEVETRKELEARAKKVATETATELKAAGLGADAIAVIKDKIMGITKKHVA